MARIYGMGGIRGGNQLFLDLYPHFFDFLWQLFDGPLWCHTHITQDGRSVTPADLKPGMEGMGLLAGNGLKAYYAFEGGFLPISSRIRGMDKNPYRIDIHGTSGMLSLPGPTSNQPDIYYHSLVNLGLFNDRCWEVIPAEPPPDDHKWVNAHHRMVCSMIDMLDGKEPEYELVEGPNARLYLEMAVAVHASHIAGIRIALPLPGGKNPFDSWAS